MISLILTDKQADLLKDILENKVTELRLTKRASDKVSTILKKLYDEYENKFFA